MGKGIVGHVGEFYRACGVIGGRDAVAVAFSGGADSVALLAASRMAGYDCVALHCNFHLRGAESDRDEAFARSMAARLGCEFRVVHFDVAARRKETGESVEMACRSLRYGWFMEQFRSSEGGWGCIAVAHHADDNVETFFLNLLRGTGMKGLAGMPRHRDVFVRPLLGVSRHDITEFLNEAGLGYVTDSSNLSTEYRRNALRNVIIPQMKEYFPEMRRSVELTMRNMERDHALLQSLIDGVEARCVGENGEIELAHVLENAHPAVLLYHIMNRRGIGVFDFSVAEAVVRSHGESGRRFRSASGDTEFLLNRGVLIPVLKPTGSGRVADGGWRPGVIDWQEAVRGEGYSDFAPVRLELVGRSGFVPSRDNNVLWLDADALAQCGAPLEIRHWMAGDRLHPFGMRGSRLVSDIYSDAKLSVAEKDECWVLVCGQRILWVPGLRGSKFFAVGPETGKMLKISLLSSDNGNINKF